MITPKLGTGVVDLIGNTPLLRLERLRYWLGEQNKVELLAKAEFANPGGSVKDRPALRMIQEGIREKKLTPDKIIMDSSSGNTGVAYAMIGAALGYRVELVIPENAGEKRRIAETFGAQVILTDPLEGSDGAILEAQSRLRKNPGRYFMPDQYNNPNNWKAHYDTTAMEIWKQTEGRVTHFVAGIGTSGTLMGTGRRLKELNPKIEVIAVEPAGALHGLEGLKHMESSIVPGIYDPRGHDRKLSIYTEDAYEMVCRIAREEGLLLGYSGGAALQGAFEVAQGLKEGVVVTVLPDRGDRYLHSQFWDEILTFWEKHGSNPL
ncbi:MAG: cysteine synthase [Elusimicrobia bacterium RIFCSPLOWO2_01_FULL_59_12]|nr:MAG: cysteine synthase [Elusimicrobia bacterium RIFCSPLOWO2_01_FULL_59_12]